METATENVSKQLLEQQKIRFQEIENLLNEQDQLSQNFYKLKGYSLMTLHVIAMILAIAIMARTLAYGLWNGLFLSNLWALDGWYWSVLAVLIVIGIVVVTIALVIKGLQEIWD